MKKLLAKIFGVSQQIWEFLSPILSKQISSSLSKLLPIALNIVKELATNNNLSNKQKKEKAFKDITDIAKDEGLSAANSLINLAIEMAVTRLKVNGE